MLKTCIECNTEFNTNSPSAKYCASCRELKIQRTCEICGCSFRSPRPDLYRPTCGKDECIKASISRKFTPERKKKQSEQLAERNRRKYNEMNDEEKAQVTQRIMNWNNNASKAEKEARRQKEMETKANWSEERKRQHIDTLKENCKKRYAKMSENDYKDLLLRRFKHLTNVDDFEREFILLNFADENGIVQFESRLEIKEYFNLQIGLGGIAQLLKRKFQINSKLFSKVSQKELELRKVLQRVLPDEKVIYNDRSVIKSVKRGFLEIDIFYPNLKVGVEFNGSYWHQYEEYTQGMTCEEYKTAEAEKLGIKLFHIWEDSAEDDIYDLITYLKSLSKF